MPGSILDQIRGLPDASGAPAPTPPTPPLPPGGLLAAVRSLPDAPAPQPLDPFSPEYAQRVQQARHEQIRQRARAHALAASDAAVATHMIPTPPGADAPLGIGESVKQTLLTQPSLWERFADLPSTVGRMLPYRPGMAFSGPAPGTDVPPNPITQARESALSQARPRIQAGQPSAAGSVAAALSHLGIDLPAYMAAGAALPEAAGLAAIPRTAAEVALPEAVASTAQGRSPMETALATGGAAVQGGALGVGGAVGGPSLTGRLLGGTAGMTAGQAISERKIPTAADVARAALMTGAFELPKGGPVLPKSAGTLLDRVRALPDVPDRSWVPTPEQRAARSAEIGARETAPPMEPADITPTQAAGRLEAAAAPTQRAPTTPPQVTARSIHAADPEGLRAAMVSLRDSGISPSEAADSDAWMSATRLMRNDPHDRATRRILLDRVQEPHVTLTRSAVDSGSSKYVNVEIITPEGLRRSALVPATEAPARGAPTTMLVREAPEAVQSQIRNAMTREQITRGMEQFPGEGPVVSQGTPEMRRGPEPLPGGRGEPTAAPAPEPTGRASEVPLNVRGHTLEGALEAIPSERGNLLEMTPEQLDAAHAAAKAREAGTDAEVFGSQQKADLYNKLTRQRDRASARMDDAASNAYQRQLDAMEAALPPAQRDRLFGIGETDPMADDIKELRAAVGRVYGDTPDELASSLKWAATKVGAETDPARMSHEERIAYAQLHHGMRIAAEHGWDTADLSQRIIKQAASRWRDPADAAFMLRRWLKPEQPRGIPSTAAELDSAMAEMRGESTPATRARAAEMSALLPGEAAIPGNVGPQGEMGGRQIYNEPTGSTKAASPSHAYAGRKIFRGYGRTSREEIYSAGSPQVPLAGEGRYYAFTHDEAAKFGPHVEQATVDLKNPLIITDGDKWRALTKEAGWPFPNPFGGDPATVKTDIARLKKLVVAKGHDGVIIDWDTKSRRDIGPNGENWKLLRNVFDTPQVVDYRTAPKGSTKAPPPGETVPPETVPRGTSLVRAEPPAGGSGQPPPPPIRHVLEGETIPPAGGGSAGSPSPEVDAFFARTGSPPPRRQTLLPRIGEQLRKTFVTAFRLRGSHKVFDPKLGETTASTSFADARNVARLVADAPRHASAATIDALKQILDVQHHPLSADQMELLRRKTFIEDLLETANQGKPTPLSEVDLIGGRPTPRSIADLTAEKARLDRALASDPITRAAYERDQTLWRAVGEDLVRRGKLSPESLREHYVHHEVMDYLTGETTAKLGSPRALRTAARRYLLRRKGSAKDIYTNYLDVRYRSLAKVIRDNIIDDAVKQIADRYDVGRARAASLGYVPFSVENLWDVQGRTSHDRAVMRLVTDVAREMPQGPEIISRAEQRLLKGKAFIHPDLAATLSDLKDIYQEPGPLAKATGLWKQAMLNKNPVRYNWGNLIGDFERGWNALPEMFKGGETVVHIVDGNRVESRVPDGRERFVRVIRDIKAASKGQISPDYRLAIANSVVDSGEVYHEIGSIKESDLAKMLDPSHKSSWLHPLRTVSGGLRNASTLRENVLRLQAFYTNLDRMRAGQPLAEGVSDIKGMSDPIAASGKIAREALGDYGDFTPREQKFRRSILPFYSWLKINTTFWPALFARKGGATGARSSATRIGLKTGLKTGSVLARATAVYAASALWNNTVQQDQEEGLPQEVRRKFHINTGLKDAKGQWITITEPTAFSDFLESVGLQGITTDVAQLLRHQLSAADIKDIAVTRALSPVRKVASRVTPIITAPTEAVTSKKFYPDPLNPSPSQKNNPISRFLSGAGLDEFTDPRSAIENYKRSWLGLGALGIRHYDAGLSALRNTEQRLHRFKERKGYHEEPGSEGPLTDVNRDLFYALQDKQFPRATSLLKRTTPDAFRRYLDSRDPMRNLPVRYRSEFAKEIGPSGIAEMTRARAFLSGLGPPPAP